MTGLSGVVVDVAVLAAIASVANGTVAANATMPSAAVSAIVRTFNLCFNMQKKTGPVIEVRGLCKRVKELDEDERAALRSGSVGFVFQSFQLMPHLTALENVMLPLELQGGMSSRDAATRARTLLEQVGLDKRTAHYPKLLSGGEQQRVALARAFVTHPAILFADEPTGSLDAATGHAVIDLMFEMNRANGATLILVTHDVELARRCDTTVMIEAGHLVA